MALDENKDGKLATEEIPERMQGLITRADADTKEAMVRIKDAFRAQLLALRPDLALPF